MVGQNWIPNHFVPVIPTCIAMAKPVVPVEVMEVGIEQTDFDSSSSFEGLDITSVLNMLNDSQ